MRAIPAYVQESWEDFQSGRYGEKVAACSRLFGLELDPCRPPFIFAGDLENRRSRKILTFGLAPYSRSEHRPKDLQDYYTWRLHYFDSAKTRHKLHGYYARLCWGILGTAPPGRDCVSQWLHENGYVTFDLLPYYVKDWGELDWGDPRVLGEVRRHFRECVGLVQEDDVRFAVFSGKAWRELLVTNPASARLTDLRVIDSFPLSDVTQVPYHRCVVYVGWLRLRTREVPVVVVGALLHQIRGLSHDHTLAVGDRIGTKFPALRDLV